MKIITLFLFFLAALAFAKAPLRNHNAQDSRPDNYIVVLKKGLDASRVAEHLSYMRAASSMLPGGHRGLRRTYSINAFNAYHVECDAGMLEEIRNNDIDGVAKILAPVSNKAAEDESLLHRDAPDTENVPWGLGRVSHRKPGASLYLQDELPRQTYAYIVDTGIRITHQEFGGRARWGATFLDEGSEEDLDFDEEGHGTHVAAIVAGNTVGVDNHTIPIAVKVMSGEAGSWSTIVKGIEWAVTHATDTGTISRSVINLSLGGSKIDAADDAIKSTIQAGMTVVVAAGNEDHNACDSSPAGVTEAITVGNIDRHDNRLAGSSWGECLDLFAPGVDIYSAFSTNDTSYETLTGTSMSSPHVAGLVTYLMSRESNLTTPAQVQDRIKDLATKDKVHDPLWSPNLIAFNGNAGEL
ncbi:hypothetical protein SLS62_008882 [Diatrype stigma]|uniref:Peptidase S8/S53 domain-containing protein n=1 Tax=Diatrype stigma TaxID=117547 RepID=A0AAN9YJT0_9PEZI